ncbi:MULTISPECIES: hypothetical protein [Mycobacteriaceae]|uniref:Uncharacterized protein n=1 Tax=Mycolicibacterium neoaurum VKM Ac-1815D TaxID=700508 RepID=V5XHF8_MYCNE|nr:MULTISPECIES: hypothetical protein [Mycobacteriaceae]AHC27880.1 hypothetical protein D174_08890 [Mycolicibacterium neoaurum VKM Ac-1815D]AMO05252.1 hypothetical protein MyAD_08735 [Mycolicibacterium neoaurum]KJQ49292.1 hypothetical protein TS71_17275 [Mycolicibacterium neoaurum]KUM08445.1 hypothetical protein AVZ31_10590 [Mycolicibacterium neoaurum]
MPDVGDLIAEAAQMPDASVRFAQGVSNVWTPEHLVALRDIVRREHTQQLRLVHAALDRRFEQPNVNWMGVFRAAAEMAVMERVGHEELPVEDRNLLLQLWRALLAAT